MPKENLTPRILLILVELSEPVHDGLRKSCRIAVVKDNRHVRLLVRVKHQVAINQFLNAVCAVGRVLVRVVNTVRTKDGRLVEAVVGHAIGKGQ